MNERFEFQPEEAALRTELVGNLKIDAKSPESQRLLQEWAAKGEKLVESGALDQFEWHREEAQVYLEAEAIKEAVWVLKSSLYEALQQDRRDVVGYLRDQLIALREDPDDLDEIADY